MPLSDIATQTCSVARALAAVGDAWTLMVIRELFLGSRRFDEFQAHTGASPHLLSLRLRELEADGIVERQAYQQHPPRHEYRLTSKGVALWPVISALREWGDRWGGRSPAERAPVRVLHRDCGGELHLQQVCGRCEVCVGPKDVDVKLSAAAREARAAQRPVRAAEKRQTSAESPATAAHARARPRAARSETASLSRKKP